MITIFPKTTYIYHHQTTSNIFLENKLTMHCLSFQYLPEIDRSVDIISHWS